MDHKTYKQLLAIHDISGGEGGKVIFNLIIRGRHMVEINCSETRIFMKVHTYHLFYQQSHGIISL